MTEDTDAAASTHKEASLGEMKYKDDKRQEVWDKKTGKERLPNGKSFLLQTKPKGKKAKQLITEGVMLKDCHRRAYTREQTKDIKKGIKCCPEGHILFRNGGGSGGQNNWG